MRLDDFDNNIRVDDQRGSGGGMRFPIGGGGKIGCGTILVALVVAYFTGISPLQLIGGIQDAGVETSQVGPAQGGKSVAESCSVNTYSRESCNALSSLDKTWSAIFSAAGQRFEQPTLHFYSQAGSSGCGAAQSAMGPFYCPADNGIYLDTDFYDEMAQRLGAKGDFARLYVIAHEYGHHIQNVLGLSDQVHRAQQADPSRANALSVRLELQADCYAGVWAAKNRDRIEQGDLEEGLNAAHQIGDDTLMAGAGRNPSPDAFTHGSSAQRMEWLRKGLETGDPDSCDTFGSASR